MKILIVTAELAPIAAAGGVAQYTMGLVKALLKNKHDVHVALPAYAFLPNSEPPELAGIKIHRLSSHSYFSSMIGSRGIYEATDFLPWVNFAQSVCEFLKTSLWKPDIVHCQDGHTALVPVYIKAERLTNPAAFGKIRTVLTIHNLLEQGLGPRGLFDKLYLPQQNYYSHFEYWGKTNCFKAGLLCADRVSTVSKTYAREIVSSEEFGFGLSGVLASLKNAPIGIVNGIDGESWKLAGAKYDGTDAVATIIDQKRSILASLLPNWSPDSHEPIIAFKARWDRQKGIELLAANMEEILEQTRFVFDTWGEPKGSGASYYKIWEDLAALRNKYPTRFAINVPGTTSAQDSAALYTLADFLIMPSIYEPCGLAQMECQRFGCIPIVRTTGGLADTVIDLASDAAGANGIVFNTMTRSGLLAAVKRAVEAHANPQNLALLISNVLQQKNEWQNRVAEYEALYVAAKH